MSEEPRVAFRDPEVSEEEEVVEDPYVGSDEPPPGDEDVVEEVFHDTSNIPLGPAGNRPMEPAVGDSLKDINAKMADDDVPVEYTLFSPSSLAYKIWDKATGHAGVSETVNFRHAIPNADSLVLAGIEFQLRECGTEYRAIDKILMQICIEFIKLRIIDWELAYVFNRQLPLRYRNGILMDEVYANMMEHVRKFGALSVIKEKLRFECNQFHLNDVTFNALSEYVNGHNISISKYTAKFPRIPFMMPEDHGGRCYPFSRFNLFEHQSEFGVVQPFVVDLRMDLFTEGMNEILKIDGLDKKVPREPRVKPKKTSTPTRAYTSTGFVSGAGLGSTLGVGNPGRRPGGNPDPPRRGGGGKDPWNPSSIGRRDGAGSSGPSNPNTPGGTDVDSDEDFEVRPTARQKKQYAKGINVGKGNTSLRDPSIPLYSVKRSGPESRQEYRQRVHDETFAEVGDAPVAQMSATILSGMRDIMREYKGSDKSPVKLERKREASENRISDFDFNIRGTTFEEILGPIFGECVFTSDVQRQTLAKEIFQRVMFDPNVDPRTRDIALAGFSQYNPAAIHQTTMSMAKSQSRLGMTSVLLGEGRPFPGMISPPIFGGNKVATSSLTRNLLTTIGGKKLSQNPKEGSKPVLHALPAIKEAITSAELTAESAFTLLENVCTGTLYDYIRYNKTSENGETIVQRFEHVWEHVQTTGKVVMSPEYYERELNRLTAAKAGKDISETMTKIQNCVFKMYEDVEDAATRSTLIRQKVVSTFYKWVSKHFPHYYASIEMTYEDARQADVELRANAEIQGIKFISRFHPIDTFVKITLRYLSRQSTIQLDHAGFGISSSRVHEDDSDESVAKAHQMKVKKPNKKEPLDKKAKQAQGRVKEEPLTKASVAEVVHQVLNARMGPPGIQQAGPAHGVPNQPLVQGRRVEGATCALCNKQNHEYTSCFTYPHQVPGQRICGLCGGRHEGPCMAKPRKPPSGRGGYNAGRGRGGPQRGGHNRDYNQNQGQQGQGQQHLALPYVPNQNHNRGPSQQSPRPSNQMFQVGQGLGNQGRAAAPANAPNN